MKLRFTEKADKDLCSDVLPFSIENRKISLVENSGISAVSTSERITSVRSQGPQSGLCRDWLLGLILILFVILAYTPVWKAGFVWDDAQILTANRCIVGPLGLKEIWTTSAADICPLTLTTFWAEHAVVGIEPAAISPGECCAAWPKPSIAVAGFVQLADPGRMAGCGALGAPPGASRIGGLDNRDEKHRIQFVLPAVDPVLCQVADSKRPRRMNRGRVELCLKLAFRRSGHGCQVFHGDSADCSLLMRLVDRGPVALAQPGKNGPPLSHGNRCQCLIDMDARIATRERQLSTMDADLAGALGGSG
jgi:hypothetical protein